MSARWDDLPPGWSGPVAARLTADATWRHLTRAQRELLLSCAAGAPIVARSDVRARLVARNLIRDDLTVTDAGRALVHWRTTTGRS